MAMTEKEFAEYKAKAFRFIWEELAPLEDEIEATGEIPRERIWSKLRDIGFLGLPIPKEYGGMGLSEPQFLEFEKEWSKAHGGIRVLLHVHNGPAVDLLRYAGREEQRKEYFPKIANGELSIAFALTEPEGGSGRDIKSRARRDGDNFVLNGVKHLITNADFAQMLNVVCWTESASGEYAISNLLVDQDSTGVTIRDMKPTMGCKGSFHGRIGFDDVVVPIDRVAGEEGKGLESALYSLNVSRVRIAATALGTMERCLDLAVDYARKRETFGKPIAERQAVQRYLTEMATDIYALQMVLADAAETIEREEPIYLKANLCKLLAIEAERRVTDNALLVMGGIGYTGEYPVERLYRDARLNWLEEGTPTIHMMAAARQLLDGERTYERYYSEDLETSLEKARKALVS